MITTVGHTLSHFHIVVAWLIFLASYLVFAIGRLPGTKIDRPAMAVIGAVGMFVFGVLTPKTAIESIDFATLVLLFSMMLIVASLHLSGFFEGVGPSGDRAPESTATVARRGVYQRHPVGVPGE